MISTSETHHYTLVFFFYCTTKHTDILCVTVCLYVTHFGTDRHVVAVSEGFFHRCRGFKDTAVCQDIKSFNPAISLSLINTSVLCFFQEVCPDRNGQDLGNTSNPTAVPHSHLTSVKKELTYWTDSSYSKTVKLQEHFDSKKKNI